MAAPHRRKNTEPPDVWYAELERACRVYTDVVLAERSGYSPSNIGRYRKRQVVPPDDAIRAVTTAIAELDANPPEPRPKVAREAPSSPSFGHGFTDIGEGTRLLRAIRVLSDATYDETVEILKRQVEKATRAPKK